MVFKIAIQDYLPDKSGPTGNLNFLDANPGVLRIKSVVHPTLVVDWSKVETLRLDPATTPISADLAPALGGATDFGKVRSIDLEKLPEGFRLQRLIFQASRKAFAVLAGSFKGNEEFLVFQLIPTASTFRRCFTRTPYGNAF